MLLFWEPRETFVVVGYANKVASEVNVAACEARGVPIYRRCSGGGTVVQMRGGLNYSLILPIREHSPTRSISSANRFIMEKNCEAIQSAISVRDLPLNRPADIFSPSGGEGWDEGAVSVRGHTDLCLGDLKFSGNSQRRRKHFLLFHGTLLLDCNLERIGELLLMPLLQPEYRASRSHADFVTNLKLPAETVKAALAKVWGATLGPVREVKLPMEEISKLAREKYATKEWNWRF
jgi:lipoate-protein ligase A